MGNMKMANSWLWKRVFPHPLLTVDVLRVFVIHSVLALHFLLPPTRTFVLHLSASCAMCSICALRSWPLSLVTVMRSWHCEDTSHANIQSINITCYVANMQKIINQSLKHVVITSCNRRPLFLLITRACLCKDGAISSSSSPKPE